LYRDRYKKRRKNAIGLILAEVITTEFEVILEALTVVNIGGVTSAVGDGLELGEGLAVGVGVKLCDGDGDGENVGVGTGVTVGVTVGVAVGVGHGTPVWGLNNAPTGQANGVAEIVLGNTVSGTDSIR
jgi:hypothetical protein